MIYTTYFSYATHLTSSLDGTLQNNRSVSNEGLQDKLQLDESWDLASDVHCAPKVRIIEQIALHTVARI